MFSRDLRKKFQQNMRFYQNTQTIFWALFFQDPNFFSLFLIYNLISLLWGHHGFSRYKDPVWPNQSDILKMFIKPGECFLKKFEKNVSAQKRGFLKIFQTYFDLAFLLIFFGWTFSNASRMFSVEFTKMLKTSERFS